MLKPAFKVFETQTDQGTRFQIFFCPSAPVRYDDKTLHLDTKNIGRHGLYKKKQSAYKRAAELNKALEGSNEATKEVA